MKRKILEFSIIWVALFCFSAVTYAAPIVNVETTAMELISESRSGRTTFDYTYKATFTNNGTDASDVTATVSSINTSVQVIEGAVVIGDLPGTIPTTSNDTFTIRVDRRIPFNADYLTWTFDAIEPISTDSLAWGEESIDAEVFNGTVVAKEVSFISTNTIENISFNIFDDCEDEGDCSARPKLVNLIEVVQLTPGPTVANEQVRLALVFSIPSDTPDGKYSGVLNVRDGERTIARPLQLDIIVTAGTATVAPDGFADPLSERIATDPIEKIRYIIDEILVVLKPDVSFDAFSSAIASMGGVIIGSDNELNTYQTRFPGVVSADALDAIIQDINLIDNVMSVSRNWEFSLLRAPDDKYNDNFNKS